MQCIFTFDPFVHFSFFFLELVVKLFEYFWESFSLFSKFCVNCFLRFYFVYCNNCASKNVNGACYCICSLVDLRVPEMCFWLPAKTKKNLELFEMQTSFWPDAQRWSRHKWRNLVTASLLLHFFDRHSCHRYWNEFSQLFCRFQIEVSS